MLTYFQNYFTVRLTGKCVIKSYKNVPRNIQHVATLPCEIAILNRRHAQELIEANCHYLPTVILIVTLIIIGIPSPTHSLTLGLNPSFSANPPYPAFPFSPSGFTIWISQTV